MQKEKCDVGLINSGLQRWPSPFLKRQNDHTFGLISNGSKILTCALMCSIISHVQVEALYTQVAFSGVETMGTVCSTF